jgi:hypothetical protein
MNTRQRETLIPVGPVVAALGAILLVVSLFLDWYESPVRGGITGFTVFEFLDLLLTALAVVILVWLADAVGLIRSGMRSGVPLVVATLALVIVLTQIVNDPPAVAGPRSTPQDTGIWLALAGAALMVAGAVLATARIAIAVEPRERGGARVVSASDDPPHTAPAEPPRPRTARPAPPEPAEPPADEAPTVADEPPPPKP